ncbi:MAG: hypothetical protein Q7V57_12605 [Actinomycetota bacterium]|nr:hypothetical protein [Actinomycetota bacterium]
MNKAWITSITIAGIVGSGGAAFAGVNAIQSASADSAPSVGEQALVAPSVRTVTYQIGTAGVVTLTSDGTTLTVTESTPATGWSLVSGSAAAAHVEVQFTDGQQLVTFLADQVGDDIAVSVTNVEAPGATVTTATTPMTVTIISSSGESDPAPTPTPAPTPPTVTTVHTSPTPSATTAPSSHEDDDDEDEDEHDDEDEGDDD